MSERTSGLEVTREQLARIEDALDSLRAEVGPINRKRYRLMAEGYVSQILDLRAEIDAILGIEAAATLDSGVVITFEGEHAGERDASVALVTHTLDAFRRGLQSLVEFILETAGAPANGSRRRRWAEQFCDLPVEAAEHPGALRIVLGEPYVDGLLSEDERALWRQGLRLLLSGVAWAGSDAEGPPPELAGNPDLWHLVLRGVSMLVPPRASAVEAIGFREISLEEREKVELRAEARERLNRALAQLEGTEQHREFLGTIREVDLDEGTFALRERPDGLPSLRCEFDEVSVGAVKALLDEPVIVTGVLRTSRKTGRETVEVETIEPDFSSEAVTTAEKDRR